MSVRHSVSLATFFPGVSTFLWVALLIAPLSLADGLVDSGGAGATHCYETGELCGWVELGTHDSMPRMHAKPVVHQSSADADPSDDRTARSIARVAVDQISEPFATVGTHLKDSLEAVKRLQSWWVSAMREATPVRGEVEHVICFDFLRLESAMNRRIDCIATEEPLDVASFGPSIVTAGWKGFPSDPVALTTKPARRSVLVGCSPMIFSLEESYMPYDMSQRDVKLWSVFPATTRPFCIRHRVDDFDASPIWSELDDVVRSSPVSTPDAMAATFRCSAYCVLEDWISSVEDWTSEDSTIRQALRPHDLGERVAALGMHRDRLLRSAAGALAFHWVKVKPALPPSPCGAALIARAGAVEAPISESHDRKGDVTSSIAQVINPTERN